MNFRLVQWCKTRALGLGLATAVSVGALLLAHSELAMLGQKPLDSLVLAILLGMVVRSLWHIPVQVLPGIRCAAKPILELAVVLMGASIDGGAVLQAGGKMLGAVVALVVGGIVLGTLLGRTLGLPLKLATLVACGNSICGNSAIASIAPVIHADEEQVATSIAFTAILSIGVVLLLPVLAHALGFNPAQFGVLAGLTVYAVPQVLAATSGAGLVAMQVGTLVKLTRVLMLGPVLCFFAVCAKFQPGMRTDHADEQHDMKCFDFMPPFILGFVALAVARSTGMIPASGVANFIAWQMV